MLYDLLKSRRSIRKFSKQRSGEGKNRYNLKKRFDGAFVPFEKTVGVYCGY